MTQINLHGILAREYGDVFKLSLPNPKDVLEAIDCNRKGFISRIIELQKEERHRLIGLSDFGIVAEIWIHTDPANPSDENDIVRLQDDYARD